MIDLNEIGRIGVRSLLMILTLFMTTKILGKKQISQLTIYDYVIGITIGSIAADIILTLEEELINGVVAIFIFCLVGFLLSWISLKSVSLNEKLNGKATVLMENGNFIYENLRKTKIPIYKFIEQARLHGYYDINVINFAVLETNGEISFLPKEKYQTSTPIDFKTELKKGTKQTFCEELIVDGKIKEENLVKVGKNTKWLKNELKKKKIKSIEEVLYFTINEKDNIIIFRK